MNDKLRTVLIIIVLVSILLLGSVSYVRIADIHFGPKETIGENPTPQERIEFGLEELTRTNYRVESTSVWTNRTSGTVYYEGYWVQRVNHNSKQIYLSQHVWGKEFILGGSYSKYLYVSKNQSWQTYTNATEWRLTPRNDEDWSRRDDRYESRRPYTYRGYEYTHTYRIPLNTSVDWRIMNQTDDTVVVGVEGPDEYRHAYPADLEDITVSNASVAVHLDKETGAITKVVIDEVSMIDWGTKDKPIPSTRRFVYEYDRSGDVSITPPEPARDFWFKRLIVDLIEY